MSRGPKSQGLAAGAVAVAAGLFLACAPGYWVFTATAGLVLAVTTLGLLVQVGWVGEVSLAQAGLTGTTVYVSAWATRAGNGLGWPFLAAAGLAVAVAALLSALVSVATARLSGIYILCSPWPCRSRSSRRSSPGRR